MIKKQIPYGRHNVTDDDIKSVVKVLQSENLTQGPEVKNFEKSFSNYIGSKYAVAVSNGTAALHLSVKALGIKPGQKVITSPISFVATSNAVLYNQGEVEFCDIDPDTLLLDYLEVRKKLENSKKGEYCGIIPVDFSGTPVEMDRFKSLAEEFDLWLLEDACHAPGGFFYDKKGVKQMCGNGFYADLAIFSFHPVKHIACGEGGMITTNNKELYKSLIKLRTHGINKYDNRLNQNNEPWYYEMNELGFNYRLSDILCSLGNSQLKRANENLLKRKELANNYINLFQGTDIIIPKSMNHLGNAYHLFIIKHKHRKELYYYLREKKILAQIHYIPIHFQPYYIERYGKLNYPNAEKYYDECLTIPLYPGLSKDEQNYIVKKIVEFKR